MQILPDKLIAEKKYNPKIYFNPVSAKDGELLNLDLVEILKTDLNFNEIDYPITINGEGVFS